MFFSTNLKEIAATTSVIIKTKRKPGKTAKPSAYGPG